MIASKDRGYYFGGSDVDKIVGNWKTASWMKWWMQKLSINTDHFENEYTLAGTHWEHRILDSLGLPMEYDRQIIIEDLRLRVNLDGNTTDCIHECKTHKADKPYNKPPKKHIQQVQIQMFASKIHRAEIDAYALEAEDYKNFFREVDPSRLQRIPIAYDEKWVQAVFLPRLMVLADCLKRGVMPDEARI